MRIKRLFLPKPVYEVFPILYLSLGISCIVTGQSLGLTILGVYLIGLGLFNSILRLNYRSPRQALTKSPARRRVH